MITLKTQELTQADAGEIFSHQAQGAQGYSLALVAAGLNYLDTLKRTASDILAGKDTRAAARRQWLQLEQKLYQYTRRETPLSLYDAAYAQEVQHYVRLRLIWLDAAGFTFTRHRLAFLLEILRFCHQDPCQVLPEREALAQHLETRLLDEYLLYDMTLENSQYVGREAVSNGYHECDFTLELEDLVRDAKKALPRRHFRYLKPALPESRMAACTAAWLYEHRRDFAAGTCLIDDRAVRQAYAAGKAPQLTADQLQAIDAAYAGR